MSRLQELEEAERIRCKLDEERTISDAKYAWQKDFDLIRRIVFAIVGTVAFGFLASLLTKINWK